MCPICASAWPHVLRVQPLLSPGMQAQDLPAGSLDPMAWPTRRHRARQLGVRYRLLSQAVVGGLTQSWLWETHDTLGSPQGLCTGGRGDPSTDGQASIGDTGGCQGTRGVPESRALPGLSGHQPLPVHPELVGCIWPHWSLPVADGPGGPFARRVSNTHTPRAGCVTTGDMCVLVSACV